MIMRDFRDGMNEKQIERERVREKECGDRSVSKTTAQGQVKVEDRAQERHEGGVSGPCTRTGSGRGERMEATRSRQPS